MLQSRILAVILLLIILPLFSDHIQRTQAFSKDSVYYLDSDHPNAEDRAGYGNLEQPWKTLDFALVQLEPGDTLMVRQGTYRNERITLTGQNSGQPEAPITVTAYPGETVILTQGQPLNFQGARWWVLDGLIFDRPQAQAVQLGQHQALGHTETVPAEHITIRNCEFRLGERPAIVTHYANHIRLENNYFHHLRPGIPFRDEEGEQIGFEMSAVAVRYKAQDIVIRGNRFEDIGSDGVQLGSKSRVAGSQIEEIQIVGNEFWVNRPYTGILGNVSENGVDVKKVSQVVIADNIIHGFRPTTPEQDASGSNGAGIVLHNDAEAIVVERNLLYDNTIHLTIAKGQTGTSDGPRHTIVRNNIFKEARASNLSGRWEGGYALRIAKVSSVEVYQNTFYDNDIYLRSYHTNNISFKNNIIIGGESGVSSTNNVAWEADYNAWSHIEGARPEPLRGEHDLFEVDLRLADDLVPLPNSPVLNYGQNLGVINDFEGKSRADGRPDLGAFERGNTAESPSLSINPIRAQVHPGDPVEVEVAVNGIRELYELQLNCRVDTAVLVWQEAEFGDFFTDPQIGGRQIGTTSGTWFGALSQKNPAPALSGNGSFAKFIFEAVAPGTALVSCDPLASDRHGIELPLSVVSNSIIVLDSSVPIPESLGRIEGTATYQGRNDHANIFVAVAGSMGKYVQTDVTGQFQVDALHSGGYNVKADAAQYLPSCTSLAVNQGQVITLAPTILEGGDTDDDGEIRINDATVIGSNLGLSASSSPPMDPRADLNADGLVDIQDLTILGGNFGKQGCQAW